MRIITGELTSREAGAQAGMDRSTSMALHKTAKDGAIAALQVLGPGRRRDAREASKLARLQAEDARLSSTIVEQAIELAALHGSRPGAEGPVPQGCSEWTGGGLIRAAQARRAARRPTPNPPPGDPS